MGIPAAIADSQTHICEVSGHWPTKRKRAYGKRIVGCLVDANAVNQLAAASARDFACRIWYDILRLTGAGVRIEHLLQALALLA